MRWGGRGGGGRGDDGSSGGWTLLRSKCVPLADLSSSSRSPKYREMDGEGGGEGGSGGGGDNDGSSLSSLSWSRRCRTCWTYNSKDGERAGTEGKGRKIPPPT